MVSSRGKKIQIICSLIVLLAIMLMPLVSLSDSPVQAAEPPQFQVAPLNPDFLEFWENPPEPFYGYVPPTMDLSHLREIPIKRAGGAATLPGSFDWRTQGKVTSVKDQNPCGTCWAHGTLAAVEAKVLIEESTEHNFSEQNLACCQDPSWVDFHSDRCGTGGDSFKVTDTLAKKGTRLEGCQPYNTDTINTEACDDSCTSIKRVTDYRLVADSADMIGEVKNAISSHGPVSMVYHTDAFPHAHMYPGNIYYWPGCILDPNHLVCIVGWDDTVAHPAGGGSGAWIVKNSWGTGWGDNGYFYLCYGSANMQQVGYFEYKDYDPNEQLYYWDEAGLVTDIGAGDSSLWGANVFTSEQNGTLGNVEFWTTSNNAAYEIYVYLDGDVSDGLQNQAASQAGTCQEMGYYSIALTTPVSLTNGQQFTVAVEMTTPGYNLPIPVEREIAGYCEPPIQTGVSFLSMDGNSWDDAAQVLGGRNVCLRARVTSGGAPNSPPNTPSSPSPANHTTGVSVDADLSWTGGDPDVGDTVTYDVYFGTSATPPQVSSSQAGTTYDPGTLSYNTKYYWYIVARDSHSAQTTGPLWDFTTGSVPNNAPNIPSNPSPANHAIGVSADADLSWTGGDPDAGDTVTYDVYFGTSATPAPVSGGQVGTTYDPGTLSYNTKYYWYIVSRDSHSAQTTGPLWDFTTAGAAGQPDITVFPTGFDVTLPPNTTQDYTLTIGNNGDATLSYDIGDRETTGGGSTAVIGSLLLKPASMVLEIPLESQVVVPQKAREAQSGWQNIMTESFEGAFPGSKWQLYGNPTWGQDGYSYHGGLHSAFCAKSGSEGVDPPGNYPNNINSWMVYGPFSLADATDAELNFWCWLDTQYDHDYLLWVASVDGANWSGWQYTGNSGGWVSQSFDLTDVYTLGNLCGESQVWIAFTFESDGSVTYEGAFIDDVVLRKYAGPANNPPQLSSPSVQPTSGTTSTNFYYYVNYYDSDGDSPSAKHAYIDGSAHAMSLHSGTASNGVYRYGPKNLAAGSHSYFFRFKDGKGGNARLPVVGSYSGPSVSEANNPPNTASSPSPANHATDVSIDADLRWTGGDPDAGDTVTYDVYFGTSAAPPSVSSGQVGTTYDPGTLNYNTKYYWYIVARDSHSAQTTGPLWDFTTGSVPNNPPNIPSNPSPGNHAAGVSVDADLRWTGGDPDVGDTMVYDVYFGIGPAPPLLSLVSNNQAGTIYDPVTLNCNTRYYWKILASDNHGASAEGPLWDFTTGGAAPIDCPWLEESLTSGSVPPGNSDSVTVNIDTTGLAQGDYSAEIVIANNDPDENTKVVPVTLYVGGGGGNNPPNTPSNPSPANHATGASINADLSWTGGDPDAGDTVTYDVYFGASATPLPVSSGQVGTTYNPGTLSYNTQYYWWIAATDSHSASAIGPLWDFTTGAEPGTGITWIFPYGVEAFLCPTPANGRPYLDATIALPTGTEPAELQGVYWLDEGTREWKYFNPNFTVNTLSSLEPGQAYLVAVSGACIWTVS